MHLKLTGIRKRFGENEVLIGIDLTVSGGEVVALLGENGAGKSTLTRVIFGAYQANDGTVEIDGSEVAFHKPQDSMNVGIQVIYQEFRHNLFPQLTVAENLYTSDRSGRHGRVWSNRVQMQKDAWRSPEEPGYGDESPCSREGSVGPRAADAAIAKAIGEDASMIILDEPTAALDKTEVEALFV